MSDGAATYDRFYRWRKFVPALFGRRCRIITRGRMNTALVEFDCGTRHIVSRHALRKVK